MGRDRRENARFRELAVLHGLDEQEVRKIVGSFFDTIVSDARGLPFNNPRKIYSKDKFEEFVKVRQVPYIGRIGPVYSRYIKWRANVATGIEMAPRSSFRRGMSQSELETIAEAILSGSTPPLDKKKNSEMFNRVWLVGIDGKKSARQVIPKPKEKNDTDA